MKDLPTTTYDTPRLSKAQVEEKLADLSAAVEITPLNAPVAIATAFVQGVPITALARWFKVPTPYMRDFVNTQLIGYEELRRITKARRDKITAEKRAASMANHPSNGNRATS